MRRPVWPVLVWLLVAVVSTGSAQQRPGEPAISLEKPRPLPVLPAVLVPFEISRSVCDRVNPVTASLRVYDGLAKEVAVLHLRGDRSQILDSLEIGCGRFVAVWDGTVEGGSLLAINGVYYFRLEVTGVRQSKAEHILVPKLGG